jgi:hypothetical protein
MSTIVYEVLASSDASLSRRALRDSKPREFWMHPQNATVERKVVALIT